MGNKINPTGFRMGVNKTQSASWYSDKSEYAAFVLADHKIRDYLNKKLVTAGIAEISIKRNLNTTSIDIVVARPGVVIGRGGKSIEELKKYLSRTLGTKVEIKIVESKSPESQAAIVAYMVADQCMRRVAPKQAIQRELAKMKSIPGVKGAKILVSGRIKGTEIARSERGGFGSVPLHTLRSDIDYSFYPIRVPNAGIHGVKVWIYKGEKLTYDI